MEVFYPSEDQNDNGFILLMIMEVFILYLRIRMIMVFILLMIMEVFYPTKDQKYNGFPAGDEKDNVFYPFDDQNVRSWRFSILLRIRMIMVSQQGMGRRDNKWVSWQMEKRGGHQPASHSYFQMYLSRLQNIFV